MKLYVQFLEKKKSRIYICCTYLLMTFLTFEIKMSELHSNNEQMWTKQPLGRIFKSSTILGNKNKKGWS